MKKLAFTLFLPFVLMSHATKTVSFYDFKMNTLEGKVFDFQTLKGKKVLLVNLASYCGYTSQYKELQQLSDQYKGKLVVLGFPSNSFFQEPLGNDSIKAFCQRNYGVTFTVFEKISVKGSGQHPLYQWLSKKELNGWNDEAPSWNFNKYLVDENGKLLKYYGSKTKPLSKEITDLL
jgi:glutathione peroxidase